MSRFRGLQIAVSERRPGARFRLATRDFVVRLELGDGAATAVVRVGFGGRRAR